MKRESIADVYLDARRRKAIRAKLLENLPRFRYEAEAVECKEGETDWTNKLRPIGPDGELVRNLSVTVKTPSPLQFGKRYEWGLLEICPHWLVYKNGKVVVRISRNTSEVVKLR